MALLVEAPYDSLIDLRERAKTEIAKVVIGQFDGLANKTAKVEAIGRELLAWVKMQKMSAV